MINVPNVSCLLLAALIPLAAVDQPSIGFRGDGSGVFPADCDPVTNWHEGQDGKESTNIVWKQPIRMFSNGGMIVAGGKLLLMAEPFPGDIGPNLYCLDPATGKELWKRNVNNLPAVPDENKAAFEQAVLAWRETMTKGGGKKARKQFEKELKQEIKLAERFGVTSCKWSCNPGMGLYGYSWVGSTMPTPVSDGEHVWVQTGHNNAACYDLDGELVWHRFFGANSQYNGFIASPLLVDGKLIVRTAITRTEGWRGGLPHVTRCLDAATGEELWQVPDCNLYVGTSVHLRLPIGGDQSKLLDVLYLPCSGNKSGGQVVRLSDGKILVDSLGYMRNAQTPAYAQDTLFIPNGQEGGGYSCQDKRWKKKECVAARLVAKSADAVTAEVLWSVQAEGVCPVYHDGLVFFGGIVLDATDGKRVAKRGSVNGRYTGAIAGGKWFHASSRAEFSVFTADRTLSQVARPELDSKPRFKNKRGKMAKPEYNEGCQMFFSGNRIFYRSYTDVYCIGDPKQAMRLSSVHAD